MKRKIRRTSKHDMDEISKQQVKEIKRKEALAKDVDIKEAENKIEELKVCREDLTASCLELEARLTNKEKEIEEWKYAHGLMERECEQLKIQRYAAEARIKGLLDKINTAAYIMKECMSFWKWVNSKENMRQFIIDNGTNNETIPDIRS